LGVEQPLVIETPKSKRIYLSFSQSFDAASYEGMTFEWLLLQYKDQIFEAIACAVQLVYFPSALASCSERQELSVAASKLACYQFEQKMDDAILNAAMNEAPLYLTPLAQRPTGEAWGDVSAPVLLKEDEVIVSNSEPETSSATPLDDFDDDFVDPFIDDDD
jgi:hypothetical protein